MERRRGDWPAVALLYYPPSEDIRAEAHTSTGRQRYKENTMDGGWRLLLASRVSRIEVIHKMALISASALGSSPTFSLNGQGERWEGEFINRLGPFPNRKDNIERLLYDKRGKFNIPVSRIPCNCEYFIRKEWHCIRGFHKNLPAGNIFRIETKGTK